MTVDVLSVAGILLGGDSQQQKGAEKGRQGRHLQPDGGDTLTEAYLSLGLLRLITVTGLLLPTKPGIVTSAVRDVF